MNNFRFTKIVAGVGPTLAKETVLSKIINMVDAFKITLSRGFDDNNKKYIDTIMKLDNSKTIILETKGNEVRVKNVSPVAVKKGVVLEMEYSEYTQENDKRVFVDYPLLAELPKDTIVHFEQSQISLKISAVEGDVVSCDVLEAGKGEIFHYDRVTFDGIEEEIETLLERDQKDILWGLEYGIHIVSLSATSSASHVQSLKTFMQQQHVGMMKMFAKIETRQGVKHLDEILEVVDGVVLVADMVDSFLEDGQTVDALIQRVREKGLPVLVTYVKGQSTPAYALQDEAVLRNLCLSGVDGISLESFIQEDVVFPQVQQVSEFLEKYELNFREKNLLRFECDEEFVVRDYIIYNACRITHELDVKAIVCFTENGYTSARLATLNPSVPVITFTKHNETYRYLNLVWGVRGYKISQSFNYENLKRIGKEMIRIIFKGNISLDDKVLIVQADELQKDEKSDMINGVELYNFKNI